MFCSGSTSHCGRLSAQRNCPQQILVSAGYRLAVSVMAQFWHILFSRTKHALPYGSPVERSKIFYEIEDPYKFNMVSPALQSLSTSGGLSYVSLALSLILLSTNFGKYEFRTIDFNDCTQSSYVIFSPQGDHMLIPIPASQRTRSRSASKPSATPPRRVGVVSIFRWIVTPEAALQSTRIHYGFVPAWLMIP